MFMLVDYEYSQSIHSYDCNCNGSLGIRICDAFNTRSNSDDFRSANDYD